MSGARPASLDGLVGQLLGARIVATEPARWGFSNRTELVTTADGRRFAVAQLGGGPLARHRVRVARLLPSLLDPAGIPTPRLVAVEPDGPTVVIITSFVTGTPGPELLADPASALRLAGEMGRLTRRLRTVAAERCGPLALGPGTGARAGLLRLPSAWADPRRLASLAGRWLHALGPELEPRTAAALADRLANVPALFAGRPAVLAHGDWAPANVIVDRGRVAAVLDWEFARLADPLFDVAWWGWVVAWHHPEVHRIAWPVFLEAAGVEPDPATAERLRSLVALRLLEAAAAARRAGNPVVAGAWTERLVQTVGAGGEARAPR